MNNYLTSCLVENVRNAISREIGWTTVAAETIISGRCNSCNMGTRDLPDMYARSPRAAGPRAEGIHIRQITRAHVTSNMYHFRILLVHGRALSSSSLIHASLSSF